ncbi:MAG: hypothetical protein JNK72_15390 [Myxococcales bacterium]|nr:hypothetical protein [Myxococcales bacterium]
MSDEVPLFEVGAPAPEDAIASALRSLQRGLIAHPVVAQKLFRALVAEGRAYAQTAEGARLREEIAESALLRRGRVVWEVTTLNIFEEHPEGVIPSRLLDAFAKSTALSALEPFLARLFNLETAHDTPARTP